MADDTTDLEQEELPEKKSRSISLVMLLTIVIALLMLAFGLAAGYIVGQTTAISMVGTGTAEVSEQDGEQAAAEAAEEVEADAAATIEAQGEAIYYSLRPEFVANFHDGNKERYLMANIDVMARDKAIIDAVEKNLPMIRYQILRVFGRQGVELMQEDGKDRLVEQVLAAVQESIKVPEGTVESIFFTSFVIQ
ncbi:MAG TPA: hypothetical protein DCF45_06955 [Gammaproteobacteria bacterium]|nr:hypothetical protein [Gammaproteobacteria bacterium]